MNNSHEIYTTETEFKKRYEYGPQNLLGEGGFAQVYKAYDKQFEVYVALKFYNKGEGGKYDVLHEMKDAREFSHKNIIRVHDAFVVKFEHTGTFNFVQVGVLEFANGGNLRDFVDTKPSEHRFIEVLTCILEGMEYLHQEKNIIHRDLSPENILMFIEGDRWVPKIADFGISKKLDFSSMSTEQKKSTQLLGKIEYMAPEQFYPDKFGIDGKLTTQVDLWAFGVILYELFMRRTPFSVGPEGNPMAAIHNITNNPVPEITDIPEPYRKVISRCLEKEASRRARTAGELISILRQEPAKTLQGEVATTPISMGYKKAGVNRKLLWIPVAIALVVAGYFIVNLPGKPRTIKTDNLAEVGLLISAKDYGQAASLFANLADDDRNDPSYDSIKLKLDTWNLIEKKEYSKALVSFTSMPADPDMAYLYQKSLNLFADSLENLINDSQVNQALNYYNGLNEPNRSSLIISGLYNRLAKTIAIDSLLNEGNNYYQKKNFKSASLLFHKVLDYDPQNAVALNKIEEISRMGNNDGDKTPTPVPSACITEYVVGKNLRIKQKPGENSSIRMLSICETASDMKIILEVQPSIYPVHIYKKGSVHAFFIEFANKTRQYELKEIRGIQTNTDVEITSPTRVELLFDRLPASIISFNLLEGKSQIDENQTYWNFIGIELLK